MKMNRWIRLGILGLALGGALRTAYPCTGFFVSGSPSAVVAKNLDYYGGQGLIFVNKRHVMKQGIPVGGQSAPKWTSKFMSLTVSHTARDFPWEGMNEAGLSIHSFQLRPSTPPVDSRPPIDSIQWIQYLLDTAETIPQAIEAAKAVRVGAPTIIHYLVCDVSSACAVFENIDGELVVHSDDRLPHPALANSRYDTSVEFFDSLMTTQSREAVLSNLDPDSNRRFSRASLYASGYAAGTDEIAYAFLGLENVSQLMPKWRTYWSMVFALKTHVFYLKTVTGDMKSVDLTKFDPSCKSGTEMLDVDAPISGEASTSFVPYTTEANARLLSMTIPPLSARLQKILAIYPETYTRCTE